MIKIEQIILFLEELNLNYKYNGSRVKDEFIEGFCALSDLKKKCITWIKDIKKYDITGIDTELDLLIITNFLQEDKTKENYRIIECDNPKAVYFEILSHFFVYPKAAKIESDSVIETENIGKNVSIGHHCYIGKDVTIGDNVIIKNNVVIECPTQIGNNTIIWSGVVIGTDGFGYYQKDDEINYKVPHFGGVKIGESVEIGANTCIDRGTIADTIIGDNVKIDNLCHIGHNVKIENNAMLATSVTLGGSSVIGENVYLALGVIILNQITVEKNAFINTGAVVMTNVQENKVVFGNPARVLRDNKVLSK
jgi:UDP-3-O-[3-hydroxymyristoyl] glucosamine N-acyltransferase